MLGFSGMIIRHLEFRQIGLELFNLGYNNSHSGNISICKNKDIFITHTGSMLHRLKPWDIVRINNNQSGKKDKEASMELPVHRTIYTSAKNAEAVIHAHAPYSIAMADGKEQIIPYDHEGLHYFKSIPIITVSCGIASKEVAECISQYTNINNSVIVAKHGIFAWGKDLNEALKYLTVTESICRLNFLMEARNVTKNN